MFYPIVFKYIVYSGKPHVCFKNVQTTENRGHNNKYVYLHVLHPPFVKPHSKINNSEVFIFLIC